MMGQRDFVGGFLLGIVITIVVLVSLAALMWPTYPNDAEWGYANGYCETLGYDTADWIIDKERVYCIDTTGTLPVIEAQLP